MPIPINAKEDKKTPHGEEFFLQKLLHMLNL